MRKVFYSFHYADVWRANKVRNIGKVEGNPSASGNEWEAVKKNGPAAIQRWIDGQLAGRTCTIVLVGAETATRPWVKYEIEKSWNDGMGLLGIRIHKLTDQDQLPAVRGSNPFSSFTMKQGRVRLDEVVPLYDPSPTSSADVRNLIADKLEKWIEHAIQVRNEY